MPYIFKLILAVGLIYSAWTIFRFVVFRHVCEAETVKQQEFSGFKFEVIYTNCDTLAKEEDVSVYAEKKLSSVTWFFPNQRNQRTLLFSYDPGRYDSPLPEITSPTQSTILISIPEVSEIHQETREWAGMSIKFDVGKVDYPSGWK